MGKFKQYALEALVGLTLAAGAAGCGETRTSEGEMQRRTEAMEKARRNYHAMRLALLPFMAGAAMADALGEQKYMDNYKKDKVDIGTGITRDDYNVFLDLKNTSGLKTIDIYVNGKLKKSFDFSDESGRALGSNREVYVGRIRPEDDVTVKTTDHGRDRRDPKDDVARVYKVPAEGYKKK